MSYAYYKSGAERVLRHPYLSDRLPVVLDFHDIDENGEVVPHIGRTKQAMRDECDINNIMKRYQQRGILTHVNRHQGEYGDFQNVSFHEAQTALVQAQEAFDSLPAALRAKFKNDPGEFLDFVGNEENRDAMIEMGLIPKPLKRTPAEVADGDPKLQASDPPAEGGDA